MVQCETPEIHDQQRILNVLVTSLTSHDDICPRIILGRCTRCTRSSSYGLVSTHSPDCPQSTCATIAGSTGQKGGPPECSCLGRIQLALCTKVPNCVHFVWLVQHAAMLVLYTAIDRASLLAMPKLSMVIFLCPLSSSLARLKRRAGKRAKRSMALVTARSPSGTT